jgi:hypothetical protein
MKSEYRTMSVFLVRIEQHLADLDRLDREGKAAEKIAAGHNFIAWAMTLLPPDGVSPNRAQREIREMIKVLESDIPPRPSCEGGLVTTIDLQELMELAFRRASKKLLRPRGELTPFFVLVGPTGERQVIDTPSDDQLEKWLFLETMRKRMRENGTVAYAFIAEAWRAPDEWESRQPVIARPSKHPDKVEVVMASATDGFSSVWGQWDIRRDAKGNPVALKRCPQEEGITCDGPILNLLGGRA